MRTPQQVGVRKTLQQIGVRITHQQIGVMKAPKATRIGVRKVLPQILHPVRCHFWSKFYHH